MKKETTAVLSLTVMVWMQGSFRSFLLVRLFPQLKISQFAFFVYAMLEYKQAGTIINLKNRNFKLWAKNAVNS